MAEHVAIYIRVSTHEQAVEGYSIGAQRERMEAYCLARGWNIHDVYIDGGFSGSNTQRPALMKLFDDIRAGAVDCVLVYKLDRLSRSQKDTLFIIEDVFLKNNVDFVSMSENFDTSSPLGRAMIGILSVFAQLEREQIRERMIMGRVERAKDGYWCGGGYAPLGYDYKDGLLIPNEIEALAVKYIFQAFIAGTPINAIHKNVQSRYGLTNKINSIACIHNVLARPLYYGVVTFAGVTYPGRHAPLIDEKTFQTAAALLVDRHRIANSKPNPFKSTSLLATLMYCEFCGASYYVKGNYSGHKKTGLKYRPYYYCYSRGKSRKEKIIDPTCKNPAYPVVEFDDRIIDEVRALLNRSTFDALVGSTASIHGKTADREYEKGVVMRRIDSLDLQISRVMDLYQLGTISINEIARRTEDLQTERAVLRNTLDTILQEEQAAIKEAADTLSPAAAWDLLQQFDFVINSADQTARQTIMRRLIRRIIIKTEPGAIDIIWNF